MSRPERDVTERVRAELAALAGPPMPPSVAARVGAALTEAQRPARGRRTRPTAAIPRRARPALLAGLAAASVAAVTAVAVAASVPAGPRAASEDSELQAAGASAIGARDAGPLEDPARRRACLSAADVPDPGATLLGGRPHAVHGEPGILLVLGTPVRGRFRLVVVDPACGPAGGRLLAGATVGR